MTPPLPAPEPAPKIAHAFRECHTPGPNGTSACPGYATLHGPHPDHTIVCIDCGKLRRDHESEPAPVSEGDRQTTLEVREKLWQNCPHAGHAVPHLLRASIFCDICVPRILSEWRAKTRREVREEDCRAVCGPCRDGNVPKPGPTGYLWHTEPVFVGLTVDHFHIPGVLCRACPEPPATKPHACGLMGYDGMKDPPCEGPGHAEPPKPEPTR